MNINEKQKNVLGFIILILFVGLIVSAMYTIWGKNMELGFKLLITFFIPFVIMVLVIRGSDL